MRRLLLPLLAGLLAGAGAAPAQALERDARYALVHGCFELRPAGGGPAVAADAGPFRMQATDLGRYLLHGRDGTFLTAREDGTVGPEAEPSKRADWVVDVTGDAYTLALEGDGGALATDGDGRPVLADAPGAFAFAPAEGCATYPESDTDVTGEPSRGAAPWARTRGLLETHLHWMAFESFGGNAHCGRPWHPYGVAFAMRDCPDHDPGEPGLTYENVLSGANPGDTHDTTGWPTFRDWPRPTSLTHEGTYHKWVERAHRGGLRLVVDLAFDAAGLCELWPSRRHECDEMDTVRRQVQQLHRLQDYVDAQAGGPGKGWLRVVRDPFEARRAINRGQLAVIIGIETSRLFDCRELNGVPQCSKESIERSLTDIAAAGVRSFEIAVKSDNALSGAAGDPGTNGIVTNVGNRGETGHFFDMRSCDDLPPGAEDKPQVSFGELGDSPLGALVGSTGQAPVYGPPPHCNTRGLSELGEFLVNRIADRGMIVDPDHMSARARIRAIDVLAARGYSGIVSSHSWSTPADEPRILGLGGLVVPKASAIAKASTTDWMVGEWKRLRAMRDPRYLFGFGYGSDMNGVARQPVPRPDQASSPVEYPFRSYDGRQTIEQATTGERTWDFNRDGVAQYGLYLDWLEELRKREGAPFVADMLRGPEAYLQMWERATGIAREPLPARARAGRRGVGRVRLGAAPRALLERAGQPSSRGARRWRWAVDGGGRVTALLGRGGRAKLVATTAPGHRAGRIAPGVRAARLRAATRRLGPGLRVARLGGGRRIVAGVRGGRVRFVAVASRAVARRPARLRAAVKAARLR